MPDILVRAVLPSISGLAEDVTVNDFAFRGASSLALAGPAVVGFYNASNGGNPSIAEVLSGRVSRAALAARVDVFLVDTPGKLAGGPLGSPAASAPFTLDAAVSAVANLPSEVACALSFHADYFGAAEEVGNTRPRARRRGRVFIGPFLDGRQGQTHLSDPRPTSQLEQQLLLAGVAMRDTALLGWSVWSRSDAVFRDVTDVWVDNAFDTIRSRGPETTSRVSNP